MNRFENWIKKTQFWNCPNHVSNFIIIYPNRGQISIIVVEFQFLFAYLSYLFSSYSCISNNSKFPTQNWLNLFWSISRTINNYESFRFKSNMLYKAHPNIYRYIESLKGMYENYIKRSSTKKKYKYFKLINYLSDKII